jgi:oxygen-independent coproporphyrinogen-3 oxidase
MNKKRWEAYAKFGVNRLSLGVQSFYDVALSTLGRDHNSEQAKKSIKLAKNTFPSVSMDLIFGWEGQNERLLMYDLTEAIKTGVEHISTYQLTIEEGTAFHKSEIRGNKKSVTADQSADLYDILVKNLVASGFEHYEVSNFAKPNHQSQHNLTYWKGLDYVGVGPGAHGRVTLNNSRYCTISKMHPRDYIQNTKVMGHGLESREKLSPLDWASEYIIMGLRADNGISIQRYEEISGHSLLNKKIYSLVDGGFLLIEGDILSVSRKGRNVLDHITREILI